MSFRWVQIFVKQYNIRGKTHRYTVHLHNLRAVTHKKKVTPKQRQKPTLRPTAMGPQKYKNEQISVGHFSRKRAMGAKKTKMVQNVFVGLCFFVVTYRNKVISVEWPQKHVYGSRSTVQNLPLRARYAQGRPNSSSCHGRLSSRG